MWVLFMENKLLKQPLLALGRDEQGAGRARAFLWAAVFRGLEWELGRGMAQRLVSLSARVSRVWHSGQVAYLTCKSDSAQKSPSDTADKVRSNSVCSAALLSSHRE